jgi:hypothetical protein
MLVTLRMRQSESVKKRWLTVKSAVIYIEALEAIQSWIYQRALTFPSLRIMELFPGLARVLIV